MSKISFQSPLGRLCLVEDGGSLKNLVWSDDVIDVSPSDLLRAAVRQLEEYFAGKRETFDLPLCPQGTAFQQKVWKALEHIPYGQYLTYGVLAQRLGSAPRAIGTACGANPLPILIPCHRVMGSGGRLTGYSGGAGIETKRTLLSLEKSC